MAENMSPNQVEYLCGTKKVTVDDSEKGDQRGRHREAKVLSSQSRAPPWRREDGRSWAMPGHLARNHIYSFGSTENRGWKWVRLEPPVNFTDEFTVGRQKFHGDVQKRASQPQKRGIHLGTAAFFRAQPASS